MRHWQPVFVRYRMPLNTCRKLAGGRPEPPFRHLRLGNKRMSCCHCAWVTFVGYCLCVFIFVLSFQGDLDNLKFGQMNTLFQLFFSLSIILKQLLIMI